MPKRKYLIPLTLLLLLLLPFSLVVLAEGETEIPTYEFRLESGEAQGFVLSFGGEDYEEFPLSIPAGEKVTVTLSPRTGLRITEWLAEGVDLTAEEMAVTKTDSTIEFLMPAANFTLKTVTEAREKHEFSVFITEDQLDMGTLWKEREKEYYEGQTVTVKLFPNEGFTFEKWLVDGPGDFTPPEPQESDDDTVFVFSFPMPDGNLTLNPVFRVVEYTFTIEVEGEGEVEVEGAVPVEEEGEETEEETEEKIESETPDAEEGEEKEEEKNILVFRCVVGQKVTIRATPAEDFRFLRWSGTKGAEFESSTLSETIMTCPASDFVLTAHFASSVRELTVEAGEGGITDPAGTVSLGVESVYSLQATPSAGYVFAGWECSSPKGRFENAKSAKTNFTMPDEDCTVTATFRKGQYTVRFEAGAGGRVEGEGGSYEMGTSLSLKATPLEGYVFSHWEVEGSAASILSDVNAAETTLKVPGRDCTVKAIFELASASRRPDASDVGADGEGGFPWIPLVIIFVLSLIAITLVILREKTNVSLRFLFGKWFGGEE